MTAGLVIGIDPGKTGAVVALDREGQPSEWMAADHPDEGYTVKGVYATERDALHGAHDLMDSLYGFDSVARMDREANVIPEIGRVWKHGCDRVYVFRHRLAQA